MLLGMQLICHESYVRNVFFFFHTVRTCDGVPRNQHRGKSRTQGNAPDLLRKGQKMVVQQHYVCSEEDVLGNKDVNDGGGFG